MTLGSSDERMESSGATRRASRSSRGPSSERTNSAQADATNADATRTDAALRLAVETLSAEICWFFANDAGARGVLASATDPTTLRRPRP